MAIHRGIQSAIFYYLSCAPCVEARYRRERKKEAARGRAERQLLEVENPTFYRQPSPSSTNPYWDSEIARGPTLAGRGRRKNNGQDDQRQRLPRSTMESTSAGQSSIDLPRRPSPNDGPDDSRWNFRIYQREDEELWRSNSNVDTASSYADSLRRPPKAVIPDSSGQHPYRNPPINDMHPATVTKISSREEVMWMLQPPPVAEVMSGKERVSRSRSDSGGSRMMSSSSASLARQLSARMVQSKMKALDTATPMSRESSSHTASGPYGSRHDQSATTSQRDFAVHPMPNEGRDIWIPSPDLNPDESEELEDVPRRLSLAPDASGASLSKPGASRPPLSTIPSDPDLSFKFPPQDAHPPIQISPETGLPTPPQTRDDPSPDFTSLSAQSPYIVRNASVKLSATAAAATPRLLNGTVIRTHPAPELRMDLPRARSHTRDSPSDDLALQPDLIESWHTPDFELGKWVHETTKREVQQRWSMDL